MNDLREVLRQHAAELEDTRQHDRGAAVHQRVQAVKRRRALAGAAVAVLVVGAVIGGLVIPQHHTVAPADRPSHMVGHAVPKTTESWGATYSYTRGYVGTGHLSVKVPGDEAVLVRVASDNDKGKLVLAASGRSWVLPGGDFGPFMQVEPRAVTVTLDARGDTGRIALAMYTLARPAPGHTRDGITYPAVVQRRPLLGSFIGAPGEDRGKVRLNRMDWSGPSPTVEVREFCVGAAPKGAKVSVDLGSAEGPIVSGCQPPLPFLTQLQDAGHYQDVEVLRAPAHQMTATVRLVDRRGRPMDVPRGLRIGAGVYGQPLPAPTTDGVEPSLDEYGHTWRLQATKTFAPADVKDWHPVPVDATLPVLVSYAVLHSDTGMVEVQLPGIGTGANSTSMFTDDVVATGEKDVPVSIRGTGLPPGARAVVATYVLDD